MFWRSAKGYRPNGRGGCVSGLVWLGICLNLAVILYSLSEGRSVPFASMLMPTADAGSAAQRALRQGDLNAAVTHARNAVQANPSDAAAAMLLTRALVYRSYTDFDHESDLTAALTAATDAANRSPAAPDALAAQAFALQANGQVNAAVQAAEDALATQPNHTLARTALALAYARAGSFDVALRESQQAAQTAANAPEVYDARRAVAISMADLGNYAQAGQLLDDLISEYSGMIPLYYERALYARQISEIDVAENAYLRVLQLQPDNVKAQLRLCELTEGAGERESALQYCQQVTERAPTLPAGWYRLGRIHFLSGDFENAQRTLNRCSSLQVMQSVPPQERIFECWYMQGQAAEILGDCSALIATYEQFQTMAADQAVRQTWTYPPEGPSICTG